MKVVHHEVLVKQPAEVVWRAHVKNCQVTLPKVVPQHYSSVEFLEGPPLAAGGVFLIRFNTASFPHFDYLKGKWEVVDHNNYYGKCRIFEGGHLGQHENANLIYSLKLEPGPQPNSCLNKWTFEFDDVRADEFCNYIKEEMSIFGASLESHLSSKT